jgi:PDZ domain-containing protein
VVTEDGKVVGVLSPSDITDAIEVQRWRGAGREPRARRPSPLVWLVVGLLILVAASLLYRPPYLVISPGSAFDVGGDVRISGTRLTPLHGRYLATTVRLRQESGLGTLIAAIRPDREVVSAARVLPRGISPTRYFEQQHAIYQESQRLAAAAAARAEGLPVRIDGSGAQVVDVVRDSPAAQALRPGDVIVAVDGRRIATVQQLQDTVRSRPAGSRFMLTVERGGQRVQVVLRSARLPSLTTGVGIGVAAQTRDLRVDLPFKISFRDRPEVGGPSAGLVYALAIADLLAPADYAAGRMVAATGTISADGTVGPVGGVAEKAITARKAGAGEFLVPAQEVDDARQAEVSGLQILGVDRLQRALQVLTPTS